MTDKITSGRKIAVEVLGRFGFLVACPGQDVSGKGGVSDVLHSVLHRTEERGKATDITFGVVRNLGLIDMLIEKIGKIAPGRTDERLRNILRVGVYELVYCPDVADYAIVNEGASLAGKRGGGKSSGFVNAVLRNVCRAIEARSIEVDGYDWSRVVPQSEAVGCLLKEPLLCDFYAEPSRYLSEAFSLPGWLVAEWVGEYGFGLAREICFASNRRCGVYLQPNTLKVSAEQLQGELVAEGVDAEEVEPVCGGRMLRFQGRRPIASFEAFCKGLFTVQDPTAAKVAGFFEPKTDETIVDLCAAPGGKTVRMAEVMDDAGRIIATDIDSERLSMVRQNCQRLGIKCVEAVELEKLDEAVEEGKADAVLVDVPCSNTGVMARRIEVRHRIGADVVAKLREKQLGLLERAAGLVRDGGRICYSTCSVMHPENRGVVDEFLKKHADFELVKEELTLPCAGGKGRVDFDGGYMAILQKSSF